jgi:DNA replication protein DnaC
LAIALGVKAVEAGYSVCFLTLEALMGRLVQARHENRLVRTLHQLVHPRGLILVELGYLPLTRNGPVSSSGCWYVATSAPASS